MENFLTEITDLYRKGKISLNIYIEREKEIIEKQEENKKKQEEDDKKNEIHINKNPMPENRRRQLKRQKSTKRIKK